MNKITEADCPPGMKMDDGTCVPDDSKSNGDNSERHKKEQGDNAGMVSDVGTKTLDTPNPTNIPATDHECPQGTSWNAKLGICEPAGNVGDVGTDTAAPSTSGKEAWLEIVSKIFEKTMAGHTAYNQKQLEIFKAHSQNQLEAFASRMGYGRLTKESAAFGNKKTESSSMVDNSGYNTVHKESVENPAAFFESAAKNLGNEQFMSWTINPTAYLESLRHGTLNYSWNDQPHQNMVDGSKQEGFTITAGDMPQIFSKQVYLIPGGRMKVPIRQFLDTQIIEDADRFNWYKVNGFDFDDTTAEGTEPTNEAQTITKIQAVPSITRAVQTVNYADIENAPFDLIEAFNRAAALGAIDAESNEILNTTYNAVVSTPNTVDTFGWIDGAGTAITDDDVVSLSTMTEDGIYAAKRIIDNNGGDSSPGNMVAFLDPQAIQELIQNTDSTFWTGSPPIGAPLHSTALGILENRLGLDIVMNNKVNQTTGGSNANAFRNIVAMKGSIGLAVAADLQIEAQRRPELSAIKVGARHRIKGAVIDESMTVRVSSNDGTV